MKTIRQTCAATILTLALTVSALAGEIDCPAAVPPPPTGTTSTSTTTTSLVLVIVNLIY